MNDTMQTDRRPRPGNETLEDQVRLRTAMIQMLHDIATHVHEAVTLDEAVQFVLCRVAEYNGWSFGHAFLVRPDSPDQLVPMQAHYDEPGDLFREFRERTGRMTLRAGEGLPGRALQTGEPVWGGDLPDDLGLERADAIDGVPIESAAAFPVTVGDNVELVLEFFSMHQIPDDERVRQGMSSVAVHLARTIERLRAEATLRESEERFRELAESINQVFWILDPSNNEVLYISPEWSRILGMPPTGTSADVRQWRSHLHPDDRDRVDQEFQTKAVQGQYDVVYRVIRSDGQVRWVHDAAVPIHDLTGSVRRIIGVAEDITEHRELEREIAAAATREQQRLSRDLHDSIGQELTGLTMMAARHARALARHAPDEAEIAAGLAAGLKRTLQQVRRISRGLAPVDIESGGLVVALAQLAEQTNLAATTHCEFRCDRPITVSDPDIATHLYQIAQEAVSNAVRHADAASIKISLCATADGYCELMVEDDGCGMPEFLDPLSEGMGLRIMQHRANLIGAKFAVETPGKGGTCVICRINVRREPERRAFATK